ncbi:MAG: hypothetical protein JOZ17_17380 [Acetobacteraceae bacterium]|nr:hypothetical protein [Acetobacteraceae bacterium]
MTRGPPKGDYEVGYCKPPLATRFKKGQSGNPKGGRKGVPRLPTLIKKIMDEPIIVTEGKRRKSISKAEAIVKQLVNRALTGDNRATQLLIDQIQFNENRPEAAAAAAPAEADREAMRHVMARMRRMVKESGDEGPDDG